jgi:hypothetical protein
MTKSSEASEGFPSSPPEYAHFNTLHERYDGLKHSATIGFKEPHQAYIEWYTQLAQWLDNPSQTTLVNQWRGELQNAQPADRGEVSSRARGIYWAGLENGSAYRALERVVNSPEAHARYNLGRNGGKDKYDAYIFEEDSPKDIRSYRFARMLASIDRDLTSKSLIKETFGNDLDSIALIKQVDGVESDFRKLGLDENSPQWRIAILAMLELKVQGHMLYPVVARVGRYASENPPTGGKPEIIFRLLLLGDFKAGHGHVNSAFASERQATINGSEYYHGLLDLIQDNLYRVAEETYPPTDQDPDRTYKAILAIKNAIFLKTEHLKGSGGKRDEKARAKIHDSRTRLLTPMKNGDIDGSLAVAKEIIVNEDPKLFGEEIWQNEFIGLTPEQLAKVQESQKTTQP